MPPLVSCIIGTFNRERYLRASLDSIFAQTYPNIEVIAVDDASTDGTLSVLEEYGDRLRIIRRTENSRTCELPRYQGAAHANGTYCAFLDSDDLWDPPKLQQQVDFLEANPSIPLCHTYFRIIDDEGEAHGIRHEGAVPPTGRCAVELLRHCFVTISSVVVRKAVWLEAQREEDLVDFGMDQDFFLTIARQFELGFLDKVLGSYRRSAQSVGQHKWRRNPRNIITLERFLRLGMWEGVVSRDEMVDILTEAYLENAEHHHYAGYPRRSLYFCGRGLRRRPASGALWSRLAKAATRCLLPA